MFRPLLTHPRTVLAILGALLVFFAFHARDFELDASADSLLLEDDRDLQLARQVGARYGSRDLLIVTFSPHGILFEDEALGHLARLRDELQVVPGVDSVSTILDVPLVLSSDLPLRELAGNLQTLESPQVDRTRAIDELTTSPVFRDLIVSRDKLTTAVLIYLERDEAFASLQQLRNALLIERGAGELGPDGARELERVTAVYDEASSERAARYHGTIQAIRATLEGYREHGELHLGGATMIADDMVTFVKSDLVVFGSCVLAFLVLVLTLIFRKVRWVVLPLLSCFYASVVMIGMLGLVGWKVTVISSNFLALMLIITISMNIHLAVRYIQLRRDTPEASQLELVATTLDRMVWPCLYTALTTIIGFCSLVLSDIKPVIDFGWMMSLGLAVAFLTSFTLLPALLMLLRPAGESPLRREVPFTAALATATERYGTSILLGSVVLAVVSAVGISRLEVENSFIDYFRQDTEIYQGMKLIDDKLGGTTPLEVLLDFAGPELDEEALLAPADGEFAEDYELDLWDVEGEDGSAYWFTQTKIRRIKEVHDYLDGLPEVGKVLSLASVVRVAEELNGGEEIEGLELSILYGKLSEDVKDLLIDPYVSIENDEARILLRIIDSQAGLRRAELLARMKDDLHNQLELADGEVALSGALVLYNNMLQSLYASQISSLGAVMTGIAIMFLVLFRSVPLAIIGIVPNLLAAACVLGLMGLAGIPLDVMTITIAAITIGIAVDNGIHYIYRFREEFAQSGDYTATLRVCHANIGRAVFYTSTTVIFGFSILMLSNFLPTIYFGVLTGLAMLIALLASLTLLPRMILLWRRREGRILFLRADLKVRSQLSTHPRPRSPFFCSSISSR
jgi:predicted RND superfamily exporter protein